ncbi:distal tail protein Dit [Enterococcus sp.]|uniref:distal tail protein Dit n=1 Tax=Enterococcus sp. TaxID=35783 RepID=UPI002FCB9582
MTSFKFNDNDFSKLLVINDIQRPLLPKLTNVMTDVGSLKGTLFNYNSYSDREIVVDYTLIANSPEALVTVKQTVAGLLFTDKPAKLIFSDAPDRYFLAVPDGDFNVEQTTKIGQGSIRFLIPDGVAHAVNAKEFIAVQNTSGVLEAEIVNQGTEECPVNIEATFHSENGVFAAVSPYSIIEVGSSTEVDGHAYEQSDEVANSPLTPADKVNWTENSVNSKTVYPTTPNGLANKINQGTWTWSGEAPTPIYPSNTEECWIGPTLYRDIDPNSNNENTGNFDVLWRGSFGTSSSKEVGREEFNLISGDKVSIAFVIRDSSYSKQSITCDYYIYVDGKQDVLHTFDVDPKKTKSTWFEIRITRISGAITFKLSFLKTIKNDEANEVYYTTAKTFTKDEYANIPITGTTYWPHAKWANRPVARLFMSHFRFRWVNVDKWSDDPNRYQSGDSMFVDSYNGKVYLNGVPILNDVVKGSEYIKVPPGRTKIQFVCSDFATLPAVKATIQEVYL